MSDHGSADLVDPIVGFAAVLRKEGLSAPPATTAQAARALASLDPVPEFGYWALRSVFVSRQEELEPFDRAYARYWLGTEPPEPPRGRTPMPGAGTTADEGAGGRGSRDARPGPDAGDGDGDGDRATAAVGIRASAGERLRDLDFAFYKPADLATAKREMQRIVKLLPRRPERRLRASSRGSRPDLRRTLIAARRTGGVPLERRWRSPRRRPARLVLVLDVSRSMASYSHALFVFALAAMRTQRRVETFAFGTRLTRVTEELRLRPDDRGLAAAAAAIPDWSGGTRIGENLRLLNERWGARGVTRGATVVILSDGWERGDPAELARELARLRRDAKALIWVNPLAGAPGYEPLVAGMSAALPHLDRFLPGNNLRALERMVESIVALESTTAPR